MGLLAAIWSWLTTGDHWRGSDGVVVRLGQHLQYCMLAVSVAALVAIPLGLLIGHSGRGRTWALNLAGASRALPTLGLLTLLYQIDPLATWPVIVALIVLAIPPMLANTVAGIEANTLVARDAAYAMGMTGPQVLLKVEVPLAAPLILTGLRSAVAQVIATATIAAYVALGGLGVLLREGLATRDNAQMGAAVVLVAALALSAELVLAIVQRLVTPGMSRFMTTLPWRYTTAVEVKETI